uniref:Uncharacterized protein n=1 Tax=uncultured prokaryote TaxID=198431 RepID=A0A0H5QLG1_9ZZZZ|nr:hypothetical protein [uncultured prokaryote]
MTSQNVAGIAKSNYRQLRVTLTHELNGTASYRVYAKRLNDGWKEQHCIASGSVVHRQPVTSTEDAVALLIDLLRQEMLPGIG